LRTADMLELNFSSPSAASVFSKLLISRTIK